MGNQKLEYSNYVLFVLQSEQTNTLEMDEEPDGWSEDDLEIIRNKKYHGIVTQFTNGLKFRGYEKDFINDSYALNGLNANLYLTKYVLRKGENYISGEIFNKLKFIERYRGLADFSTKQEKDGVLEIKFNSDELEQLLKSHESDDFEIERQTSIDGKELEPTMELNKAKINGRALSGIGEHTNKFDFETTNYTRIPIVTIPSTFISKGFGRHIEVVRRVFDYSDTLEWQASFFYDDLLEEEAAVETKLEFDININCRIKGSWLTGQVVPKMGLYIGVYSYTGDGYVRSGSVGNVPIHIWDNDTWDSFQTTLTLDYGAIVNRTALSLEFMALDESNEPWVVNYPTENNFFGNYEIATWNVKLKESSLFETDENTYKFAFVNETMSRLMEIITGEKFKFYSKLFGRKLLPPSTGAPPQYQDYDYGEDGEFGNVGLISGLWVRRFMNDNPLYKSLTISPKHVIESLQATFNVGIGVEDSDKGQRVRIEELKHFYRKEVVVILPNQISKVSRSTEGSMFYSGASFGCDKGGDYEHGLGLDEPNLNTDFITPLRRTDKKYKKISKIRSDDTGLEITRREPAFLDKTKDTSGDSSIWYLDLKRNPEHIYERLDWEDMLSEEPTGVLDPETYKNWRFTPKRCMLRHGWVLRAGMEQEANLNKFITISNTNANVNLETTYIGQDPVTESADEKVGDLDRSRILPERIKLTHPIDDNLMDWILGTTEIMVGNELEEVPNWYFKFQWVNEKEENETGYLVSLKPKNGQFEFFKANETMYGVEENDSLPLTFSSGLVMSGHIDLRIGGVGYIDWGDGTITNYSGESVVYSHYYALNFNGTIKFYGTLTRLHSQTPTANLYHDITSLPDEMTIYVNEGVNESTGNVNTLKEGLLSYWNIGLNLTGGQAADFPSTISTVIMGGNSTLTGDISDVPSIGSILFWNVFGNNTVSDYTSGVAFNPGLYLFRHLPTAGNGLSSTEIDNLLIDLANSITSPYGTITLNGENGARTSASDGAVLTLESINTTVTTN
jgi:hypothetical protein